MAWDKYIGGAAVQASITLAVATQALLVPRLLGANEYGRAMGMLAWPLLVQAGLETVVFALTIRWGTMALAGKRRRLWTDAICAAPAVGVIAAIVSMLSVGVAHAPERAAFLIGAPLLVAVWVLGNLLMGSAYALHRHGAIVRTYLLSAIILPAGVFATRRYGAVSFLAGFLLDKIVAVGSLWIDRPVRDLYIETWAAKSTATTSGRVLREYLPVLAPRLMLIVLSPGLVAAGALLLPPHQLAGLKVSLSFVTAAATLVPVSQYVLQAQWTAEGTERRGEGYRELRLLLAGALLFGCLFAAGLFGYGDRLRSIVLHTTDASFHRFNVVFAAVPLFVLIGPISSILVARELGGRLMVSFLISTLLVAVITFFFGLAWGFVAGSATFVLSACGPVIFSSGPLPPPRVIS
jgi:hypothetical protein